MEIIRTNFQCEICEEQPSNYVSVFGDAVCGICASDEQEHKWEVDGLCVMCGAEDPVEEKECKRVCFECSDNKPFSAKFNSVADDFLEFLPTMFRGE